MYLIVDLETRAVLTNRDGVDMFNVNEELARNAAQYAQHLTNHPHAVILAGSEPPDLRLTRDVAPWL